MMLCHIFVWFVSPFLVGTTAAATMPTNLQSPAITRHHMGDHFIVQGATCYKDLCVGFSSGTAGPLEKSINECGCQCMPNLPIFRDDLNICVDDVQECTLAPFLSGTTTQKIPFVFLPLKGQIVYPSAEITFSEVATPICVVSGAQFLGKSGWIDLRNNSDTEPPFRLFRDEGRTYLQWLGDGELRNAMEGRLILVHLMCKDASETEQHRILTPCVAFRVAGNPSVREVIFANDVKPTEEIPGGLSVSEYIAIGICSVLLGLIYVASILLYLHLRKRKQKAKDPDVESTHLSVEEGVVKNNPLLQPGRRRTSGGQENAGYSSDSASCCSDSDVPSDLNEMDEDGETNQQNHLQISAMVHPCVLDCQQNEPHMNQDNTSFERLPEEDVSIVEEVDGREERPETVRAMGGANIRRKLYFNPAYFDPDLLKTPPPAAVEFLTKIREVITIAKHKMSAKRFSPSLIGIPEEDGRADRSEAVMRRRSSSITSIKDMEVIDKKLKSTAGTELPTTKNDFNAAASGSCCARDTKQRIIRRWLEDVPLVKSQLDDIKLKLQVTREVEAIKEKPKTRMIAAEVPISGPKATVRSEIRRPSTKGPAPPRPPPPNPPRKISADHEKEKEKEIIPSNLPNFSNMNFLTTFKGRNTPEVPPPIPTTNPGPLPSVINTLLPPIPPDIECIPKLPPSPPPFPKPDRDNTPRIQGKDKVPPAVAKTLMDAVIKELVVQKKMDPKRQPFTTKNCGLVQSQPNIESNSSPESPTEPNSINYEADSLERAKVPKSSGFRLFDDVNEIENDYDNQIDSCIDICPDEPKPDVVPQEKSMCLEDHDYEVILLNPELPTAVSEETEFKIYNLPELLAKNEGYSLVSEVYVNDGYSFSSSESPPSSAPHSIKDGGNSVEEKPGRLTIQVKDSPENYKHIPDESENFEPDTLDRKPGKLRIVGTITNWEDSAQEKYSNQRFHNMDMDCRHQNNKNQYISNDAFMDSLERPQHILLKSDLNQRKNSIEKHVDDLLKTLECPLTKEYSSLRDIYEAKSRNNRRRTETTSLVGGSVASDTDCLSTLSWNEDRRNKLLHRGIVLHMGRGKKSRRKSTENNNYPDVVPPRPPKPPSLSNTPQRSAAATPSRSYCQSPANRSVCQSPNRSACTSPPPRSNCLSPTRSSTPPPPPPPRATPPPSPLPKGLGRSLHPIRTKCHSPTPPSPSQCANMSRSCNGSGCTSPLPRNFCATSPCASPNRSVCASPTQLSRSACTSPQPPPRPCSKPADNSPPLPPRNLKPPLPPKNAKGTRQKKVLTGRGNLARRPLPPLPSRSYIDTLSSVSSRDLETLSTLSGASMDSLNSSDYEAFYTLPYDGNEGEIYDKAQEKFHQALNDRSRQYKMSSENVFSTDEDIYNAIDMTSSFSDKVKDLRQARGRRMDMGKKWKAMAFPHRPDDSGYLSTDSNESGKRMSQTSVPRIPERAETPSQGSETEDSNCDGASESGAESTATDSFFFGNFRKSGSNTFNQSFRLSDVEVNSDTERHNIPILVRP